ncbi:MAG: M15 family metallopeptidase [Desulfovibrio sp.]|nr:M15 family metallopeptidase [Desulfovibrio sp.]
MSLTPQYGNTKGTTMSHENAGTDLFPSSFVLVTDIIPDILLDIRYYSTFNFIGDRIDGYEASCALLTREAAEALKCVSDEAMGLGFRLMIYDAYRPQRAVDHFSRWASDENDVRMKSYFYPKLEKHRLFELGFILRKSAHSRGSTVDLTLFDVEAGRKADMGSNFDFFGQRSRTDYTGNLTAKQKENRQCLRSLMTKNGFLSLKEEWWHFTLANEPYPDTYFDFPVVWPCTRHTPLLSQREKN